MGLSPLRSFRIVPVFSTLNLEILVRSRQLADTTETITRVPTISYLACKVSLTPLNYKRPVAENLNISTVQMFFSFCKRGITASQTYPGAELAQFRALPPALDELEAGVLPKLVLQIFDRGYLSFKPFRQPQQLRHRV